MLWRVREPRVEVPISDTQSVSKFLCVNLFVNYLIFYYCHESAISLAIAPFTAAITDSTCQILWALPIQPQGLHTKKDGPFPLDRLTSGQTKALSITIPKINRIKHPISSPSTTSAFSVPTVRKRDGVLTKYEIAIKNEVACLVPVCALSICIRRNSPKFTVHPPRYELHVSDDGKRPRRAKKNTHVHKAAIGPSTIEIQLTFSNDRVAIA